MRLNVKALADAVDTVLAENRQAWERKLEEVEAERERERAEWLATHADEWRELARLVARRLAKGRPITNEDLPMNGHRYVAVFRTATRDLSPYKDDLDLVAFRRLLDTIVDETVTTAGLRDVGVTSATLRRVVSALAPRTVAG